MNSNDKVMYCVVKRATIRKSFENDSEVVGEITFGKQVFVKRNEIIIVNGKIFIYFYTGANGGFSSEYNHGWVNFRAVTFETLKDYAGLFFTNETGKRIPVADRYQGDVKRYIMPGEQISMIAKVGDWCLTSKGWSKFEWFTKCRDILNSEALTTLCYEILKCAVDDYRTYVTKIKRGKYRDSKDFCEKVTEIEKIEKFFKSNYYKVMFDAIPGEERLKDLNEELLIDQKWIDEKKRIKEQIKKKKKQKA